jgi:NAD+ synthetase
MEMQLVRERLVLWLREKVSEAGARGLVVGLSGGIDSAVVAALAREAFPQDSLAVWMPCQSSDADARDAEKVARTVGIPLITVTLDRVWEELVDRLNDALASLETGADEDPGALRMAAINVKPRLRMTSLHYIARAKGYLVAGATNRSELTVGYFTKFGDSGVDLMPLGGLVKTQVWELARELGIPEEIIRKAPSAGLWEGQTDEQELGMTYGELDRYLLSGEGSAELKARVARLEAQSDHKRRMPPIFEV